MQRDCLNELVSPSCDGNSRISWGMSNACELKWETFVKKQFVSSEHCPSWLISRVIPRTSPAERVLKGPECIEVRVSPLLYINMEEHRYPSMAQFNLNECP